ncbi:putative HD superfamily hydrolase involved in NAD metabolism [Bacillus mesophilus]|uniref:bis(5'-nucleosyl)-tetraphosphatase (symmetrical) n=1 Tax=Bacillus mesophilus TaxID=1808955 RepID=A0A6M0Q5P2_9BACI|nr:bis(5'-nucleosyl)-tetraphosphatase (symmetrical) YqeK [Bacillus mesophilus]MBM7660762.1 putative HD superfamily hydrolase involved in NAD metabolism [Bacillus mesophilus]NEY71691.1 HD domain-containing protein [Bacillus mesophilus]
MNRENALSIVREQLTDHRYLHTIGVMETAIELAQLYQGDVQKSELAAIFHDYAKFRPKEEMKQIIVEQGLASDLLQFDKELWHAPVGAYLVKNEVGIKDLDILNAIKYHTSGRINMTLLEKIIYLADYIEPGRRFPGVEEVREIASTDLDLAVIYALRNTIQFLLKKQQAIYPDTFHTYNTMVQQYKQGGMK